MVLFKHLFGSLNIDTFLRAHVPGQFQNGIQIISQHCTFRRAKRLLLQTFQILQKLAFHVFAQLQCTDFLMIFAKLVILMIAKLITNDTQLLTQIVITLLLIDIGTSTFLNVAFKLQHLNFLTQKLDCNFKTTDGIHLQQQLNLVLKIHSGILRNGVCKESTAVRCQHFQLHRLRLMLRKVNIVRIKGICLTAERTCTQILSHIRLGNRCDGTVEIRLGLGHLLNAGTANAAHQDTDCFTLSPQNLLDLRHCTNGVQVLHVGIVFCYITLRNQQQSLILFHCLFKGKNRLDPTHFKMNSLIGKYCKSTQC